MLHRRQRRRQPCDNGGARTTAATIAATTASAANDGWERRRATRLVPPDLPFLRLARPIPALFQCLSFVFFRQARSSGEGGRLEGCVHHNHVCERAQGTGLEGSLAAPSECGCAIRRRRIPRKYTRGVFLPKTSRLLMRSSRRNGRVHLTQRRAIRESDDEHSLRIFPRSSVRSALFLLRYFHSVLAPLVPVVDLLAQPRAAHLQPKTGGDGPLINSVPFCW